MKYTWGIVALTVCFGGTYGMAQPAAVQAYRSPVAAAASPDGQTLFVSDRTANCMTVLDLASAKPVADIPVAGEPNGLALSADGKTLYVAERKAHAVAVIDTAQRTVTGRIAVGLWPVAVVLGPKGNRLYTCNQGDHTVSAVDLATGKEIGRVPVVREPVAAAITPDESRLMVANFLPQGKGTDPTLAAEVSILDPAAMKVLANVKLPAGSTTVRGLCTSPDGKWAYVVHSLGRFNLPITQLERGWVHTYALSILDIPAASRLATVLLDDLSGGAADPWGAVLSPDGKTLAVSHAGTHELSLVDVARLHDLLAGKVPDDVAKIRDGLRENIWVQIRQDPKRIERLPNDLTALYIGGAVRRVPSGGLGPRGLAFSPDGLKCYAANYYSGAIGVVDVAAGSLPGTIALGPQPAPDAARRGEIYFHDATRCFQHWHSCATCHPEGRVDGLPWDFQRDGIGNGKDTISLVEIEHTSPHNRRATRADPAECMRTGVTGIHLVVPQASEVSDLVAYAAALQPEANPAAPELREAADRGKLLFEGKGGCAECHPAPYFTDRKMHNVGIITPSEPDGRYDTPSLVEAYRTAPYYHDGRAATLKEALTTADPAGQHGNVRELTPQEIDDLVAYVLTL